MNTNEIEIKREVFDENSSETNEIQTRPLISKLVEYTGGGRKRSISSIEEQNQHGKFDFKTAFIKSEPLEDDVMQNDESCGDFDNNNADIAKIKQEHIEFDLDIVKEEISDVARIKQERIEISDRYKSENQAKPPSDDASPPKKRRASVKDEVRDTPEYEVSLDIPPDVRVGVPDRRRTVRLLTEEEASRLPITVPTPRGQKAKPGELPKKKGKAYSCKDCSQVFSAFADLRTHSIVHQVETRIPDNSVRNSGRHSWSKEDMAKAIESVQQKKMGWLKASTTFNVPQATLRRHFRNVPVNLGRFKPTFQLDIEKQLVEHLLYFENSLFAFNATDVRKLVYEFAKKAGLPNRFDEGKQMAGWDWLKGFRKRNPVISSKIPEATSAAMAKAFNKTRVMKFYELLENMVTVNDIPSSRIYNMDESELKPPKVGGEPGQRVSIAVCANAAGSCIPPAMIIPRKNFEPEYFDGAPPGTLQLCYDRGYMVGELFVQWIKHFVTSTGCSTANKVILILDGHSSHKNLEALEFAKTSGVILLCLPSHCTHQMQPLEISFFGPLHACYEEEISTWLNTHPGRTVGLYQMAGIFGRAYESAASVRNITSGFEKAGIYPLNAPIFPDRLFLPSEVTENVTEKKDKEL